VRSFSMRKERVFGAFVFAWFFSVPFCMIVHTLMQRARGPGHHIADGRRTRHSLNGVLLQVDERAAVACSLAFHTFHTFLTVGTRSRSTW
jgi:hypothetical protein